LKRQRIQAYIRHLKEISDAFIWGEKKLDATTGRTQTQGMYKRITGGGGYTKDVNGNLTVNTVLEIMRNVFKKGSSRKIALCAPIVIDAFCYFKKDPLIMKPSDEWYNLKIGRFESGQGELTLVKVRQLEGDPGNPDGLFGGSMIIFDPEYVTYRHFQDDDTHLETNVQNNDDHGQIDEYLSDVGLEMNVAIAHGVATRITGYE